MHPDISLLPCTNPFNRGQWHGKIFSMDGSSTKDFDISDLDRVICGGDDGFHVAGICQLKDKRFVAWETFYDVTGDGFSEDAYGGDADIFISSTLHGAAMLGLTPDGRNLCRYRQTWAETHLREGD